MFKDARKLHKQAREIQKDFNPSATLGDAMERMKSANEFMAQQTQAANIAATGIDATATITSVSDTGMVLNYQPTLQIGLTVMPDGRPPYPVTVTQMVAQIYLSKAVAGRSVPVRVDPNDPGSVWINWAAA